MLFWMRPKTAENSEKQRAVSLLFRPSVARKPRISAGGDEPLAVNFREEQRKQREVHFLRGSCSAGPLSAGPKAERFA
jgi:hypothetical protein